MADQEIKVGDIIYPNFDGCWKHNQRLGMPSWSPIQVTPCSTYKGYPLPRGCHHTTSICWVCKGGSDWWDPRMDNKLMYRGGKHDLVCFIEGEDLPLGDYTYTNYKKEVVTVPALLLDPPDEIYALGVTRVSAKSVTAKVVRIPALP